MWSAVEVLTVAVTGGRVNGPGFGYRRGLANSACEAIRNTGR